jgi:hypothetical protein
MAKRKITTDPVYEVLDMWETDLAQAEIDNDAVVLYPCMVCNCLFELDEVKPCIEMDYEDWTQQEKGHICNGCEQALRDAR